MTAKSEWYVAMSKATKAYEHARTMADNWTDKQVQAELEIQRLTEELANDEPAATATATATE